MARGHSSQGGISRAPPFVAAHSNHRRTEQAGAPKTSGTGKTSLAELIERVQTLRALLTNDTGTMHLADGLGVPLVAVFGSTEPRLTGPNSPTSIVLRHQTECSPCFLRKCPLDFRCMLAVAPEEAAHAIFALLDEVHRKVATVG